MEKIKIKNKEYEILDIHPVGNHVICITFSEKVPEEYGDIDVYTAGGVQSAHLPGFLTLYCKKDKTLSLSDDGSVCVPSEPSQETQGEPYTPSLEEEQVAKLEEINQACREIIQQGVDVGGEHYSLMEVDQINLFGLSVQLAAGAKTVPYHADDKLCKYYTPEEITPVIAAATKHVAYHTTYCNSMHAWIRGCKRSDEVKDIHYGVDIPEQYQSDVLKAYLKEVTP